MPDLASAFTKLNPFTSKGTHENEDEDFGEEIDDHTVAGGGHSARRTEITEHELRVSRALRSFLVDRGVLLDDGADLDSEQPGAGLKALLDLPHIVVPPEVTDRSFPLSEYFISSSHNTYLLAHQLTGKSDAEAYRTALNTGARCVEIDAWDDESNKEEPKVTHGYTLVSHIPFRAVCETIRDVVDKEAAESRDQQGYRAAPIMLSLENHCGAYGQTRLVQIMHEVWGSRLLSKAIREKGHGEQEGTDAPVRLEELGSKIVLMIEYHFPEEVASTDDSSSSSSEDEEERQARHEYKENKAAAPKTVIVPELADLGVYAQSVKPVDNSWFDEAQMKNGPHNHLINISELQLASYMPGNSEKIAIHNSKNLMRVYPKGTRISSTNLKPATFWAIGAQICALNWQTFGASLQLNEALFSGTDGYVLKPAALRAGGNGHLNSGKKIKLRLQVAGGTDIPLPKGRTADDIKPYLTCTLVHPDDVGNESAKRKTAHYRQHKLGLVHKGENPPNIEPFWDETLEWEYEDNELVFLRMLIKSDDAFSRNPIFAVSAVRLSYVERREWRFVRMLDLHGKETKCTILVKFDFEEVNRNTLLGRSEF
ncbi:putative 1-phosphatidylinositol-4,5-bisphosphate phosphodiesterase 1 [Truncatella angustata]|uniref:Phosphoinositide phospholipase C n=1 Tax=Truncatella angustata TaxID=152316 RepID=A0A9P8UYX5_9PEZI|nr:putative 1-phosphatidylinositol-4,5-bisphosphate phosphodiesterase 1 [Truncatella angustata]KAH6660464.1 putative 1-phosphatidylinositol-4,5-bisphosphate phosphodiesterase 1 [Truncatella angustata]